MKIGILKEKGCPNCLTEETGRVWSLEAFKPYRELKLKGRYGNATVLLSCANCDSEYIRVNDGHLLHLLAGGDKVLFYNFFDQANRLSQENLDMLGTIGSPDMRNGEKEYPAQVQKKDGGISKYSVIRFMSDIWPISIASQSPSFVSVIDRVIPSKEAMTLEQRKVAFKAPELGMGYSPIWLENAEQSYRISYGQFFIPQRYGPPELFSINRIRADGVPWIDSVQCELFIGFAKP